jgi:hypothetical protein
MRNNLNSYIFKWFKYEKYGEPIVRYTFIESSDVNSAMSVFKKSFGGLKKNAIVSVHDVKNQKDVAIAELGDTIAI